MNVRCPTCETVYRVDPAKVPSSGVRARCGMCAGVIAVSANGASAAPVAPAATAPAPAPPRPTPVPQPEPTPDPEPEPQPEPDPGPPPPPPAAEPAPTPTPEPPRIPTRRVTAPFFQPRRTEPSAPKPAPSAPAAQPPAAAPPPQAAPRPSAPVFTPTPGTPVRKTPAPTATPTPAPPAAPAAPAAPTGGGFVNPFLAQDPRQKARRLARALVSDMIVYQPDKRQQALASGNVKDAFEEEIAKSWEEYVEQVGEEIATSTPYWKEALNEILAGGQQAF